MTQTIKDDQETIVPEIISEESPDAGIRADRAIQRLRDLDAALDQAVCRGSL